MKKSNYKRKINCIQENTNNYKLFILNNNSLFFFKRNLILYLINKKLDTLFKFIRIIYWYAINFKKVSLQK